MDDIHNMIERSRRQLMVEASARAATRRYSQSGSLPRESARCDPRGRSLESFRSSSSSAAVDGDDRFDVGAVSDCRGNKHSEDQVTNFLVAQKAARAKSAAELLEAQNDRATQRRYRLEAEQKAKKLQEDLDNERKIRAVTATELKEVKLGLQEAKAENKRLRRTGESQVRKKGPGCSCETVG